MYFNCIRTQIRETKKHAVEIQLIFGIKRTAKESIIFSVALNQGNLLLSWSATPTVT